jgi:2-succinyl-6-hydroxy-2,4-cyclohexadiene-1-carboxylate synthase
MILGSKLIGVGPCATFVHGFTQTGVSWMPLIHTLTTELSCTLIDAPGHGTSPNGVRTLVECGNDIGETMPTGILVGYSMGARIALHTAIQHPEKVTQLVLISGTAGISDATERQTRKDNDIELAQRIEDIGVESFIDEWLALPMFKGLSSQNSQRRERLTNSATGLADSLRNAGTGTQEPLWDQLSQIQIPVLLVTGALDHKFSLLAQQMHEKISDSTHIVIDDAGHTVHLEQAEQCEKHIRQWLYSVIAITKPTP